MVIEGNLTLGGEKRIQYTGDVLWTHTLETYILLLANVTPTNSRRKIFKHTHENKIQGCEGLGQRDLSVQGCERGSTLLDHRTLSRTIAVAAFLPA